MRLLQGLTLFMSISHQIPILSSSRAFSVLGGRKQAKAGNLWGKGRTEFVEAFFLFSIGAMLSLHTCGPATEKTDIGTCLIPRGIGFLAPWCRTFGRYFLSNPRDFGAQWDATELKQWATSLSAGPGVSECVPSLVPQDLHPTLYVLSHLDVNCAEAGPFQRCKPFFLSHSHLASCSDSELTYHACTLLRAVSNCWWFHVSVQYAL